MTPEEYYQRALARGRKGDYDGAIADFTKAIELSGADSPKAALAYVNRGAAHGMKDDYDGAIADCDKAIALWETDNPEAAKAYVNRGFARGMKGDHDGAIADCNTALRLEPDNKLAISYRAMAQMMKAGAKSRQELEKRLKESYEEQLAEFEKAGRDLTGQQEEFERKRKYYQKKAKKYKKYFDRALIVLVAMLSGTVFLLIYDLVCSKIIAESIKDAGYAVIFPVVVVFISLSATLAWGLRVLDARYHEVKIIALDYERKILVGKAIPFYAGPGREELLKPLLQQYMDHWMSRSPAEIAIALRNRDGGAADSTVIHNVAGRISPKGTS